MTIGNNLAAAYERAAQLEWMCQVYFISKVFGNAKILNEEELADVAVRRKALAQEKASFRPVDTLEAYLQKDD